MSELINAIRAKTDQLHATVVTRNFQFEGDIHCPKTGKDSRRLSNLLNSDRKFIVMTEAMITNRLNGTKDPNKHPYIQISVEAIEFIKPHLDEGEELTD